jgi:tetratricopeptide (TPR) repeat protein
MVMAMWLRNMASAFSLAVAARYALSFSCRVLLAILLLAVHSALLSVMPGVGGGVGSGSQAMAAASDADSNAADSNAADSNKGQEKTRKTPALSNAVYEQLTEAQALSEAGDSSGALRILNDMRDARRNKLNSYELANLYNLYAFIYYQGERYKQAIQAYAKVLAQPNLPLAMETNTLYSLAQLYFVVENYPKAIQSLKQWFALAENPQPDVYVLLAQAYYQTQDYNLALSHVETAMRLAREKGKQPQENWYLLMRVLYYEKGDMKKVAWVLEQLVRGWPKKEYLTQLSGIRGELRQERRQVVAMETAYVANMLSSEQELLNMAYLYLGTDTPYKAAQVLNKGLEQQQIAQTAKNYALLGNALRAAQELEQAIPAMERAAELADDGEPWAVLANIYLDMDNYSQAARAARTALNKGKLRRADHMRVALGMALFNLEQLDKARVQFELAAKDKRSRKIADDWINYLDSELLRRQSLLDDLS